MTILFFLPKSQIVLRCNCCDNYIGKNDNNYFFYYSSSTVHLTNKLTSKTRQFPACDHSSLALGLDHNFLELLHSYLSNRYQRVRIDGMLFEVASVTSGVPQGSILGPLLFLLFVNDLPSTLSTSSFLFADDLKCCSVNFSSLQTDLSALQRWCTENFLDLHPEKCKILSLSALYIGNTLLDSIQSFKDLDVIFTSNLSWSLHVAEKISKCYKVFFMLKRNVPMSSSRSLKINLYKTCILSILSYASPIWSPSKTDHQKL